MKRSSGAKATRSASFPTAIAPFPASPASRAGAADIQPTTCHNGTSRVLPGGLTEDDGAAAARTLLAGPLPGAVTVFNDRCALGLLDVLRLAGRTVPDDVSVVGYDDSRIARLSTVDLTSVAQDVEQLSTLAVRRALDRLDGVAVRQRELVVPPRLVVRSTTAAPR